MHAHAKMTDLQLWQWKGNNRYWCLICVHRPFGCNRKAWSSLITPQLLWLLCRNWAIPYMMLKKLQEKKKKKKVEVDGGSPLRWRLNIVKEDTKLLTENKLACSKKKLNTFRQQPSWENREGDERKTTLSTVSPCVLMEVHKCVFVLTLQLDLTD